MYKSYAMTRQIALGGGNTIYFYNYIKSTIQGSGLIKNILLSRAELITAFDWLLFCHERYL